MIDLMRLVDQIERTFEGNEDVAAEIAEFVRQQAKTYEMCEGYSNYETSTVALMLEQTQDRYESVKALAAIERYADSEWPLLAAADALKDYVEDWLGDRLFVPNSDAGYTLTGLKNAALGRVNWKEIVEGWFE